MVYILKTDYPINVWAAPNPSDPETVDKIVANISEVQIYRANKKIDFKLMKIKY